MQFLILDGSKISRISAHSKGHAASIYAQRHLPTNSKSKSFRIKVVALDEASTFETRIDRIDDVMDVRSREVV